MLILILVNFSEKSRAFEKEVEKFFAAEKDRDTVEMGKNKKDQFGIRNAEFGIMVAG